MITRKELDDLINASPSTEAFIALLTDEIGGDGFEYIMERAGQLSTKVLLSSDVAVTYQQAQELHTQLQATCMTGFTIGYITGAYVERVKHENR